MSDTPRTDESVEWDTEDNSPFASAREWVYAGFARQLERELAEARDQLQGAGKLMKACDVLVRNLAEVRKQRDTLVEALHSIRHRLGDFQEPWNSRESYIDTIAHQAIAAVEGGSHE